MDHTKDTLDLRPYFKLLNRIYKKIILWFNRKIIFILIVFIALIGLKAIKATLNENSIKYSGIIDKEFLSNNDIIYVLKFLDKKIQASNAKKPHESNKSDLSLIDKLNKIEYDFALNVKDEIIINSNEGRYFDSIDVNLNVPLEITLHSIHKIDSIGRNFINYLNNHTFLIKLKQAHIVNWNKQKNELIEKIDFVDLMILKSQTESEISENNTFYFNNNKHHEVFGLIKYKDNLIERLTRLESYLARAQKKEIFIIDGFNQVEKSKYVEFYSINFYIKYIFYSTLIVLIFSTLFRNIFNRSK